MVWVKKSQLFFYKRHSESTLIESRLKNYLHLRCDLLTQILPRKFDCSRKNVTTEHD